MEPGTFSCSICGDNSRSICVYCTKDACGNHLCERCRRCSDCCECGVPMGNTRTEVDEAVSPSESTAPSFASEAVETTSFPAQSENS